MKLANTKSKTDKLKRLGKKVDKSQKKTESTGHTGKNTEDKQKKDKVQKGTDKTKQQEEKHTPKKDVEPLQKEEKQANLEQSKWKDRDGLGIVAHVRDNIRSRGDDDSSAQIKMDIFKLKKSELITEQQVKKKEKKLLMK